MSESDARTMILKMLSEGKITVEESERLLNAVNKENFERDSTDSKNKERHKKNSNFPYIPFLEATKLGIDLTELAETIHKTVQQTIRQVEPKSKELKEKMKEFGNWMEGVVETIASELNNQNSLPADCMSVDFIVPAPEGIENCKYFTIENVYGEIRLSEGPAFKLLVNGQIGKNVLGEMQSSEWFTNNAIKVVDDRMYIGFDTNKQLKAIIDLNLTLPKGVKISCKTVNSAVKTKGALGIDSIKSISGNITVDNSILENSEIESVSGAITFENLGTAIIQTNTISGDITAKNCGLKKLKINSVSGDITIADSKVSIDSEIKTSTTSGDISIKKIQGPWKSVNSISKSGKVAINWQGNPAPASNQKVTIKSGGEGAVFYAESVSGDIIFK